MMIWMSHQTQIMSQNMISYHRLKRLRNDQLAMLSRAQKKSYFYELELREKLFMKKQLKEEKKLTEDDEETCCFS